MSFTLADGSLPVAAARASSTSPTFMRANLPLLDEAARRDDLFVQPLAVAADDHQPGVGDDGRRRQQVVRHDPGRDPLQPLALADVPDLGPQQPQAHLRQPVVQVDQHHVVLALGRGVVEDDGPDLLGVRVRQPIAARRPASLQGR